MEGCFMDKRTITRTHATSCSYNDESFDFTNQCADLFQLIGTLFAGVLMVQWKQSLRA